MILSLLLLFAFDDTAFSQELATSVETVPEPSSNTVAANLEFESEKEALQSALTHHLKLEGAWSPSDQWEISAELETETSTNDTNPSTELGESKLALSRQFGEIKVSALTLLPTEKTEQNAGMTAAPGVGISWKGPLLDSFTIQAESFFVRFLRDGKRASAIDPNGVPAASESDSWRSETEIALQRTVLRNILLEASAHLRTSWMWFGGRSASLELEQRIAYLIGRWSFGLGHRNETNFLSPSGGASSIALYRPEESSFFGQITLAL